MKICHMTSGHSPEDIRIFHKECTSLVKAGYEVYVVERGKSYEKSDVHMVGIGEVGGSRFIRLTQTAKQVYQAALALDADLYHFHDPELLPYGAKLKKAGKRVIFDSHEHTQASILEKDWIPLPVRKLVYHLFGAYQRSVCRKLDGVIAATPNVQEFFATQCVRSCLVTNYPIVTADAPVCTEKPSRSVVFAGNLSRQWNHDLILDAVRQIPDCRYILCTGDTGSELERLKSLPGWERVDFRGRLPHEQVGQVLASAAVGLSLLTPGGNTDFRRGTMANNKIFEEMLAGIPVVCSDFVRWKEFVERWHCGICVDPQNTEQIREAVQYLLSHPDEARQMGQNGRRAVEQEFNWGVEEKKLLALYQDIFKD